MTLCRWRLYDGHSRYKSISIFRFCDISHLGMLRNYLHTKFRPDISIHDRDDRLLKTNVRHIEILLLVSILTFSPLSTFESAPAYQTLYDLDDQRQSYDVISIFQDGGHTVANLLPFMGVVTAHVSEAQSYLQTKFRPYISIHGWGITTSIPESKRSPY